MKSLGLSLLLAAGLMTAGATQTAAQQTGGGVFGRVARQTQVILEEAARRDREAARQESARQRQRAYDPRYETGARKGNGGGPPFCRNGQGHPTKGWQWCVDKGWGSPAPYARSTRRGGRSDAIFGIPQAQQQPPARGNRRTS
jgi:hypothetical protein